MESTKEQFKGPQTLMGWHIANWNILFLPFPFPFSHPIFVFCIHYMSIYISYHTHPYLVGYMCWAKSSITTYTCRVVSFSIVYVIYFPYHHFLSCHTLGEINSFFWCQWQKFSYFLPLDFSDFLHQVSPL